MAPGPRSDKAVQLCIMALPAPPKPALNFRHMNYIAFFAAETLLHRNSEW